MELPIRWSTQPWWRCARPATAVRCSWVGRPDLASAFEAVEQVREVLAILEKQLVVVSLIDEVLERGMRVAIGEETGVEPLAECSIVVAPYQVEGQPAGRIGILGPTRMDYSQALSAVAVVSRRLGIALSEG